MGIATVKLILNGRSFGNLISLSVVLEYRARAKFLKSLPASAHGNTNSLIGVTTIS